MGFKLVAASATRIMFKTFETVEASDGSINAHGIEVLLEQEDDGQWRLERELMAQLEQSIDMQKYLP